MRLNVLIRCGQSQCGSLTHLRLVCPAGALGLQLRVFIGAKRECGVLKRVLGAAVRAAAARLGTARIHAALAARILAAALRRVAHESAAWFAAVHFVRMVYVC